MNRSAFIADTLRRAGIDACLPGQHEGICLAPYAVVRQMSGIHTGPGSTGLMGGRAVYRVMVLVPAATPELLDSAAEAAARALLPLREHGLILSQPRGAVIIDDAFRAVTTYLEYVSYFS